MRKNYVACSQSYEIIYLFGKESVKLYANLHTLSQNLEALV